MLENKSTHLVIRADAGGMQGTGHVMRMIALAQAYQKEGGEVIIASRQCPESVIDRVKQDGIEHRFLGDCELGDNHDAELTLKLCHDIGATWLVLDGYHFDEDYQKRVWNKGSKILVVDDYGHCETWHADAFLNQNLGSENWKRGRAANPHMQWLMGSSFALLRDEFLTSIRDSKEKKFPLEKILVTMGGADPDNVTLMVLEALEKTDQKKLKIRVLVGGANSHGESLSSFAKSSRHDIEIHNNVHDMPAMYEWADGVISAGGSTCWEWLAYGLSGAVVTIAENQQPIVAELINHKLAISLGWFTESGTARWPVPLTTWLDGKEDLANFHDRRKIIDGYGAARVASIISGSDLIARQARPEDAMLYFEWANDSDVRASGFDTRKIKWDEHITWFNNRLEDSNCHLYLVSNLLEEKLGQVRLTPDPSGYHEISFSVDSNYRSRGIGKAMLEYVLEVACHDHKSIKGYIARVKKGNKASGKIFVNLGFKRINDDPKYKCLVYIKTGM